MPGDARGCTQQGGWPRTKKAARSERANPAARHPQGSPAVCWELRSRGAAALSRIRLFEARAVPPRPRLARLRRARARRQAEGPDVLARRLGACLHSGARGAPLTLGPPPPGGGNCAASACARLGEGSRGHGGGARARREDNATLDHTAHAGTHRELSRVSSASRSRAGLFTDILRAARLWSSPTPATTSNRAATAWVRVRWHKRGVSGQPLQARDGGAAHALGGARVARGTRYAGWCGLLRADGRRGWARLAAQQRARSRAHVARLSPAWSGGPARWRW